MVNKSKKLFDSFTDCKTEHCKKIEDEEFKIIDKIIDEVDKLKKRGLLKSCKNINDRSKKLRCVSKIFKSKKIGIVHDPRAKLSKKKLDKCVKDNCYKKNLLYREQDSLNSIKHLKDDLQRLYYIKQAVDKGKEPTFKKSLFSRKDFFVYFINGMNTTKEINSEIKLVKKALKKVKKTQKRVKKELSKLKSK